MQKKIFCSLHKKNKNILQKKYSAIAKKNIPQMRKKIFCEKKYFANLTSATE